VKVRASAMVFLRRVINRSGSPAVASTRSGLAMAMPHPWPKRRGNDPPLGSQVGHRRRIAMAVSTGRRKVVAGVAATAISGALVPASAAPAARTEGTRVKDVRFVVFHTPGPKWLAGKTLFEQPGVMEHVGHYKKLLDAGKLAMGGPHVDLGGGGMMIPLAGVSEAEMSAFAAEDPAVKAGLLRFEVRPWLIGMSA
jgi:uncharacterized protein YciI